MSGLLSKIKYFLVTAFYGEYQTEVHFDNGESMMMDNFVKLNEFYLKNHPYLFYEILLIPHDSDSDILRYIMSHSVLSQFCLSFPARIYHYL